MYYGHNLQFESAAAMFGRQLRAARDGGTRRPRRWWRRWPARWRCCSRSRCRRCWRCVRFERWDDVLAQPAPPAGRDLQSALYHFARGAALAGKGQAADARQGAGGARGGGRAGAEGRDVQHGQSGAAPARRRAARSRGAHRRRARRRSAGGRRLDGAPSPPKTRSATASRPTGCFRRAKASAAALMRAGNAAEAEKVYRADLEQEPQESAVALRPVEGARAAGQDGRGGEGQSRVRRRVGGRRRDARPTADLERAQDDELNSCGLSDGPRDPASIRRVPVDSQTVTTLSRPSTAHAWSRAASVANLSRRVRGRLSHSFTRYRVLTASRRRAPRSQS